MSTSTTSSNRFTLVKNWNTETLIIFLRDLNINLDEDDFKIFCKQKIDGQTFPDMTKRKFMKDNIKRRPAMKLEKQAKILKERTKALKRAKLNTFGFFHAVFGLFSILYPGQLICLDLLKETRHIQYFIIHYIFFVMIQIPCRRFSKLLEISYLIKRYAFSISQAQTHIFFRYGM